MTELNENNQPPQFLKNIPHEYILLPNIKGSYPPCGIGKKWTLKECEYKMTKDQYISCCYYLKYTNYAVVDIDDPNYTLEQFYEATNMEKSFYTKGNTKGFYIWMELPQDKEETLKKYVVKCSHLAEIDYLGEKVFERVGKEWFKDKYDEPSYFDQESFKKCFQMDKLQQKKTTTNTQAPTADVGLLQSIVNIIAIPYLDDRDAWIIIMCAMKKCGFTEEQARQMSMKSERFTEDGFIAMWNSYSIENITASEGTLRHCAKLSNNDLYYKTTKPVDSYFLPLDVAGKGALSIASYVVPRLTPYLKYCNECWYMFNDKTNLWIKTKQPTYIIIKTIHKYIDNGVEELTKKRRETHDDDQHKKITEELKLYMKLYDQVDKTGFYAMIKNHLQTLLLDDEFSKKLDTNLYEMAFKNGMYDLRTNTFRLGFKLEDYLTKTIPFDYEKPSQEDIDFVKNQVLFKICNANHEHLEYYLRVLGQAMTGNAEMEKALYFLVGVGGNNGKTLVFEALKDIMPNYVVSIDGKTFQKDYAKAHKHLQNLKGARIAYVEELSNKEQNIELLKQLGDGKTLPCEVMYGTDEEIDIVCKLFCLANCQANLKVDGGIGNRYRQLCFNSSFEPSNTEDNFDTLQFVQNRELAGLLKGKYKHTLIQLLMDYAHKYSVDNKIIIPHEFQEATKDTLENNDEVKCWIEEYCEYGEEFKCSKHELEEHLNKPFREIQSEIQRITKLKYQRTKKYNGKVGCFIGFRIKPVCELGGQP